MTPSQEHISRFVLAILLLAGITGGLAQAIDRSYDRLESQQAALDRLQHSLAALQGRRSEFAVGSQHYLHYAELQADGLLSSPTPETIRRGLKSMAQATGVTLTSGMIAPETRQALQDEPQLHLVLRPISITLTASSDQAIFAFLDRLCAAGYGRITLDKLDLQNNGSEIAADLALTQMTIQGAPLVPDNIAQPTRLPLLAEGKALFPPVRPQSIPQDTAVTPSKAAAMFIQVEQAEK